MNVLKILYENILRIGFLILNYLGIIAINLYNCRNVLMMAKQFYITLLMKRIWDERNILWNFMSCSGSKSTYSSTYLTFWLLDRIIVIILFVPFRTCNFLFEIVKLHDSTYLSNLNTTLQKNILEDKEVLKNNWYQVATPSN